MVLKLEIKKHTYKFIGILAIYLAVTCTGNAQKPVGLLKEIIINYDSIVPASEVYSSKKLLTLNHRMNNLMFVLRDDGEEYSYSFKLKGFDEKWSPWMPYGMKEYTFLKPGKYTLTVRRLGKNENIKESEIILFKINPAFYSALWFLPVYLFACFFMMLAVFRIRRLVRIRNDERLEEIVTKRTEKLELEKEKSESLLANMLPKGTADEIKSKGKAEKHRFNFVTVLFSDIQGFTRIAEETNPEVLIDELDQFFFKFDTVVEKFNIEKIKTIGDAYMCAGGIPTQNRTNPIEVILAALEMQNYLNERKVEKSKTGKLYWDIRIGIHTGPVVAGVVGQKKLSYDIWGDTVNTASRMESSGVPGKINISGVTYENAKEFFIFEYRGKMPVKYKGELDMYFVNGIRPELRDPVSNGPNEVFKTRMSLIKLSDLEEVVFNDYAEKVAENIVFHNVRFLKNVYTQAELIGRAEQIDDSGMLRLLLASLFLFSGFMNEPAGDPLEILERYCSDWGFDEEVIKDAGRIIKDCGNTNPQTEEGMILRDAIYDYYGRVDYLKMTETLYREVSVRGSADKLSWFNKELDKLKDHRFLTKTSNLLRSVDQADQVKRLKEYISTDSQHD